MPADSAASTPGDAGQLGVSNDPARKRAAQVTSAATSRVKMSNADRVRAALERAERDAMLLDGRDFDAKYWIQAKRSLSVVLRELGVARSERDALKAVVDASA